MRGRGFANPTAAVKRAQRLGVDKWRRFSITRPVAEPKATTSFWVHAPRDGWMDLVAQQYATRMAGSGSRPRFRSRPPGP